MSEELETVLRLVAEGRLTPEEAAPIITALTRAEAAPRAATQRHASAFAAGGDTATSGETSGRSGRQLRIRVTERGRQVVNLRIPIGFVDTALQFVPGLAGDQSSRIRDAVRAGTMGPILDVEEADGSGVLISVE
jgi:hypothetical protein